MQSEDFKDLTPIALLLCELVHMKDGDLYIGHPYVLRVQEELYLRGLIPFRVKHFRDIDNLAEYEAMESESHKYQIIGYIYNSFEMELKQMTTPEYITSLEPNEIFVFGSNLAGAHGGGAARIAHSKFGAVWGQGIGLQGQSYAIPTMQGGVDTIKPYVDEFIAFASSHPELVFYVTRIGCGIAGFMDEEIAPLFKNAVGICNIVLPKTFVEILK